ncbi:hypothetical protein AB6A40_001439 [Gnathostoma spinigerum]|uniref:Purple acid phosphatase n=1 Tax=Gnathostoma spinigerum TaxID=75299 RepID=A0ABD6EEH4_9BILA
MCWFLLLATVLSVVGAHRNSLCPLRIPLWLREDPNQGPFRAQPEQIALSYAGDPTQMWITWLTFDDTLESIVEFGETQLEWSVRGNMTAFIDGGEKRKIRYIHRVLLENLKPGTSYIYHVGSTFGWSSIYHFTALHERPDGGYIFGVYGDLGYINPRSLGKIQQNAQRGLIDMVLHIGDIAYDLHTDDGDFGDAFGRQIEPISATIPYMMVVGNHENAYNFSHFVNRYTMPNTNHNLFYSFDLGPAHFVAISTEFYFFTNYGWEQLKTQWNWLIADLEAASKNRDKHPWIITMGHRPMYCSNYNDEDCTRYECVTRVGLPDSHAYGLEKLFHKYGVDLEIWAHQHSYERMWPVYNRTVFNGSADPYVNPPAPVHVVTGSAGCQENTDPFVEHPSPWSAFRSSNYGFSRMHIFNSTHLYFEQLAAIKPETEDSFWLIKHEHGPYYGKHRKAMMKYGFHVDRNWRPTYKNRTGNELESESQIRFIPQEFLC